NGSTPGEFWAHHQEDEGKSTWEPAIEAANRHEISKQELESIRVNYANKSLPMSLFRCWCSDQISGRQEADFRQPWTLPLHAVVSTFESLAEASGDSYNRVFSRGRPCWKALKDAYRGDSESSISETYAWKKVKGLVKAKLQGGTTTLLNKQYTLCFKFYYERPWHLAISQDRTKVLACYPPEPLVTEAAYELLDDDMLHRIAQALIQGIVEPGEIVGELILVLTRQKLQEAKKPRILIFMLGKLNFLKELLNIILQNDNLEHNRPKLALSSTNSNLTQHPTDDFEKSNLKEFDVHYLAMYWQLGAHEN
ncbi:13232_t:CDS:2, partial [Ambispora gerdemannii]